MYDLEKIAARHTPEEHLLVKGIERRVSKGETVSEEEQIKLVSYWGGYIEYIENPSVKVQLAAVHRSYKAAFMRIENPDITVQIEAVRQDAWLIRYIQEPTEIVQVTAITTNPSVFKYIKNPTELTKRMYYNANTPEPSETVVPDDTGIQLLQYANLRKHFSQLIKDVLGADYYNEGMDVYICDELACRDLKARMKGRAKR